MNKKIFLELERKLLQSKVRKSPSKISELLADDLVEFCSSGKNIIIKKEMHSKIHYLIVK